MRLNKENMAVVMEGPGTKMCVQEGLGGMTAGFNVMPKGTDFTQITDKQIVEAQERLNHRPRKSLGYKTPFEVFFGTIAESLAS